MDASDAGVCSNLQSQKKLFALTWNKHEKECIRRFKDQTEMNLIYFIELQGVYFSVRIDAYGKYAHKRMVVVSVERQ
jgi:hypothetical protein